MPVGLRDIDQVFSSLRNIQETLVMYLQLNSGAMVRKLKSQILSIKLEKSILNLTRIFLVHSELKQPQALEQMLCKMGYQVIGCAGCHEPFADQITESNPDAVLLFLSSPDIHVFKQIKRINRRRPIPLALFSEDSDSKKIHEAVRLGVASYVVNGFSLERVGPVLEAAIVRFGEFQALQDELAKTKKSLAERKLLDRAKGLIMQQRRCSEPEAYRLVQKMAMDRQMQIAEVARQIVQVGDILAGN